MALSNDLVSQFAKMSKDNKKEDKETTVYGKIVQLNNTKYVQIDGSDRLTPISSTTDALNGERVTVMIKNHNAIVNGNISSPAARTGTVQEIDALVKTANSNIETIDSDISTIKSNINTVNSNIKTINSDIGIYNSSFKIENGVVTGLKGIDVDWITTEELEADHATIGELDATYAKIKDLDANYADIDLANISTAAIASLDAKYAKIETLNGKYANIDFSNIGEAAIKKFYATSGIIKDLTIGDTTVTGKLVGVTVSGDLIEGNTIKADKLLIKGDNGLYYGMNVSALGEPVVKELSDEEQEALKNGIHGTNIIAKSVTADKINVTDLQAFNATIAGFNLTDSAMYSGVKSSVDNGTSGIYLDKEGQISFGDGISFVKFYKDTDDSYKLEISADNISFGAKKITVEDAIQDVSDNVDSTKKELSNATKLYYKCFNSTDLGLLRTDERVSIEDYPDVSLVEETLTTTGEQVYTATDSDNSTIYICEVDVTDDLDNYQKRLHATEATIQNLGDSLLYTVTNEEGGTSLKQTSTGWTFDLDGLKDTVDDSNDRLGKVEDNASEIGNNVSGIKEEVENLSKTLDDQAAYIKIFKEGGNPYLELGNASDFKIRITNNEIEFLEGSTKVAYINNNQLYIERATMKNELEIGNESGFIWKSRSSGNMGLQWFNRTDSGSTTYTITYDANGGSGAPASQIKKHNVDLTISSTEPTREGYKFEGWATTPDGSPCYGCGSKCRENCNLTLYAIWSEDSSEPTPGGTSFDDAISISLNETVSTNIETANQKMYYKFIPTTTGTYVFKSTGTVDTKIDLYKSSDTSTTIGSGDDDGSDRNFNLSIELTAGETYYAQVYCYGTNTGAFSFSVVKESGSSTTTYTITFNANDGSGDADSLTKTQGTSIPIPYINKTRSGYTFVGWSTSSTATTAMYKPEETYTINENITLYAVWVEESSGGDADGSSLDKAIGISLNENVTVTITTAYMGKYYKFTPSTSGTYVFESTGSVDPLIWLNDSTDSAISMDHNSGSDGKNFKLTVNLTAGETYYPYVRIYDSGTGTFNFSVTT